MGEHSNIVSIFGFLLSLLACGLIVVGFSTPYWLEPDRGKQVVAKFDRIGLWEICFKGYSANLDAFGRTYNGCFWIFAREYDAIRKWLLPEWFVATQALMTLGLIFSLLGVLFGIMLLLGCFPDKMKKYVAVAMSLGHYAIGLFMAIALIYFGTNAEVDRRWLTQASYRHLSWSFFLAVVGGLIALLSGMCYTVYFIQVRTLGRSSTAYRAHELRYYHRNERRSHY